MLLEGVVLSVYWEFPRESAKKLLLLTKLFHLPISNYAATLGRMTPKSLDFIVDHIKYEDVPLISDSQKVFKYFQCINSLVFPEIENNRNM